MRSQQTQSKHNKKVSDLAWSYNGRGYTVKADVGNYPRPRMINGKMPDLWVEKDGQVIIIEVETYDSVNTTHAISQKKTFQEYADRYFNVTFRPEMA